MSLVFLKMLITLTAMIPVCLVYFKTDGWPWIHLDEAGSSGSEVVAGRYTGLSL